MEPKVIVVSVPADESKVQVIAEPAPKVVVPTSVESKLIVKVPALLSEVSMPLVPPAMVRADPKEVDELPRSPANEIVELSSSAFEIEVPRVVVREFPLMARPVPVKSEMVSPPTVKDPAEADPVTTAFPEMDKVEAETDPVAVTFVEKLPAPTTSKAADGAVVPIPRRLENEAVPEVKIC